MLADTEIIYNIGKLVIGRTTRRRKGSDKSVNCVIDNNDGVAASCDSNDRDPCALLDENPSV